MAEELQTVEVLEKQLTALTGTHKNVASLIEKLARIQAEFMDAGDSARADELAVPFSALSQAAESLQETMQASRSNVTGFVMKEAKSPNLPGASVPGAPSCHNTRLSSGQ